MVVIVVRVVTGQDGLGGLGIKRCCWKMTCCFLHWHRGIFGSKWCVAFIVGVGLIQICCCNLARLDVLLSRLASAVSRATLLASDDNGSQHSLANFEIVALCIVVPWREVLLDAL